MNIQFAEDQMTDEVNLARARADYLRNMAGYILNVVPRQRVECAAIKEAGRAAGENPYEIGARCKARILAISDEVMAPFSDAIVGAKRIIYAHAPDPRREFRELSAALPDEVKRQRAAMMAEADAMMAEADAE
jgi:hypothetical protein